MSSSIQAKQELDSNLAYLRPSSRYPRRVSKECIQRQFIVLLIALTASITFYFRLPPFNGRPFDCRVRILLSGLPQKSANSFSPFNLPHESPGAIQVTAASLLQSPPTHSRIIHQSWKTADLGHERFVAWNPSEAWKAAHPGWVYVLWTDEDNLQLVQERYPELLDVYIGFAHGIARADFARNLYMHAFGGVYADLDVLPLSNMGDHFHHLTSESPGLQPTAYIASMPHVSHLVQNNDYELGIPNAWMASSRPGHGFWMFTANETVQQVRRGQANQDDIERLTGPVALYRAQRKWRGGWETRQAAGPENAGEVVVIEDGRIYPYSWNEPSLAVKCICSPRYPSTFDADRCANLYPDAWTITYWTSSWFAYT